jgi:hypothetical protein
MTRPSHPPTTYTYPHRERERETRGDTKLETASGSSRCRRRPRNLYGVYGLGPLKPGAHGPRRVRVRIHTTLHPLVCVVERPLIIPCIHTHTHTYTHTHTHTALHPIWCALWMGFSSHTFSPGPRHVRMATVPSVHTTQTTKSQIPIVPIILDHI